MIIRELKLADHVKVEDMYTVTEVLHANLHYYEFKFVDCFIKGNFVHGTLVIDSEAKKMFNLTRPPFFSVVQISDRPLYLITRVTYEIPEHQYYLAVLNNTL